MRVVKLKWLTDLKTIISSVKEIIEWFEELRGIERDLQMYKIELQQKEDSWYFEKMKLEDEIKIFRDYEARFNGGSQERVDITFELARANYFMNQLKASRILKGEVVSKKDLEFWEEELNYALCRTSDVFKKYNVMETASGRKGAGHDLLQRLENTYGFRFLRRKENQDVDEVRRLGLEFLE